MILDVATHSFGEKVLINMIGGAMIVTAIVLVTGGRKFILGKGVIV